MHSSALSVHAYRCIAFPVIVTVPVERGILMQRCVSREVIVSLPPAEAWLRLRDLGKAHCYVPGVTNSRIDTQLTSGVGASRTVFLKGREAMEETEIQWHEGSDSCSTCIAAAKPLRHSSGRSLPIR